MNRPRFTRWWSRWGHELLLAGLLVGLLLAAGRVDSTFIRPETQFELSSHVWELALLALPMTLIVISGGIDLSVASTMALSAVALGLSYRAGMPIGGAVAVAVATGCVAGAVNGVFVAYVRVHPLIVTLATLSAYRGVAEGISRAEPVSGFPEAFLQLGTGKWLGLPWGGYLFAAASVAAAVVLSATPWGRMMVAMGFNEQACRFCGIGVQRIKVLLYAVSGTTAGLAAVLFVARRNTAKADIATGWELDVITAVVVGGTSIFGGRGHIVGTVLGVLLIHEVREFVSWYWNRDELTFIVVGSLLVGSVLLNNLFRRNGIRQNAPA